MNIILLEKMEAVQKRLTIDGNRAEHIVKVLRSGAGDLVKIGVIDGHIGTGKILAVHRKQPYAVDMEIKLSEACPPEPPIDLLLALPRPIMLKRILSQAAALGVGHIYIINANRVERSFWDASLIRDGSWRGHLLAGLEQAVDTRLPTISFHRGFKPFFTETIFQINRKYKYLLAAHPGNQTLTPDMFATGSGKTLLGIGPEGGWVDYEIEHMRLAEFKIFGSGPRILKVDTAVVAFHSIVSILIDL